MRVFHSFKKVFLFIFLIYAFCSFSSLQASSSPYGINAHIPDNQVIQMINQAGIAWIRVDFPWDQIEPTNDSFSWHILDDMVNEARAKGLSLLVNLGKTPSWANSGNANNYPPTNSNDWKDFVQRAVNRYKDRIQYWAMWNEPNLDQFWKGTMDDYVNKILIPGVEAARTADPTCKIVGPELAHLQSGDAKWNVWLRGILRSGGKERLDIISHHIYDREGPTNIFNKLENDQGPLVPSVQRVLQEEGVANKLFWITETGWDSDEVGEDTQSDYYLSFLQGMRNKSYINKIFFYEIIDDPDPNVARYGIIHSNYSPKKAYTTYKDFIAGLYPPEEPEPPEESDGDKDCPISTALGYREISSANIDSLKYLRDHVLKKTIKGSQVVDLYYHFAPELNSIFLTNPYACQLASDCLQPFISFSAEIFIRGIDGLEERYLSEEDVERIMRLIEMMKHYANPGLQKVISFVEEELPSCKEKSLNRLILDLDFRLYILREGEEKGQ